MTSAESPHNKLWLYAVLAAVLLACLWIGWRDFDPWIPQDEVRENIRMTIRRVIQLAVQYVIPAAILVFFGREILLRGRGQQRKPGDGT